MLVKDGGRSVSLGCQNAVRLNAISNCYAKPSMRDPTRLKTANSRDAVRKLDDNPTCLVCATCRIARGAFPARQRSG
jgi:hypothetical protein